MRPTRFRFTIQRMMVAVVILAVLMRFYPWLLPGVFQAPDYVLGRLPERMQRLRHGMTRPRVWWELGLTPYRAEPEVGKGSCYDYLTVYSLGSGYHLHLRFDETFTPARFTGASLNAPDGQLARIRRKGREQNQALPL